MTVTNLSKPWIRACCFATVVGFFLFQFVVVFCNGQERSVPKKGSAANTHTNSIGMKFRRVPKGEFWISQLGRNAQRKVKISSDFYIGVFEVTQGQWQAIMGTNPSGFSRTGNHLGAVKEIADADLKRFPVETVSWNSVQTFIKALSKRERASGWTYRLPTSAEWEYACRGAAKSKADCSFSYYVGKPSNQLSSKQANFCGDFPAGKAAKGPDVGRPTIVGSYPPNLLGLYDMHGNVWEWTASGKGRSRVIRGGSWFGQGAHCRAGYTSSHTTRFRDSLTGFRLVAMPATK